MSIDLNLLDWGHTDQLAVGLGCSAYLFNPRSLKTHELLQTSRGVFPSSLRWNSEGNLLAVGLSNTELQVNTYICFFVCLWVFRFVVMRFFF